MDMSVFMGMSFFWFGIVGAVFLSIVLLCLATETYVLGALLFVALFFWTTLTPFSAYDYLVTNWLFILEVIGGYILLGFVWATFAWVLHLHKARQKYREVRGPLLAQFLVNKGVPELTPDLHEDFRNYVAGNRGTAALPNVRLSKGVLAGQIILWPLKMIGFFLGDAIRVLVDGFVAVFGNLFGTIKRRMLREFTELEL